MKRIISIILALALVAAMLPTFAFAAEGEAEGIRIKYDLLGAVTKLGASWENSATNKASRIPFTEVNYNLTGGLFSFADSSNDDWSNHSSINWSAACGIQLAGGQYIAYEVYVPKAGTYTMEMWCGNSAQKNSMTSVYLSRGEKSTAGGDRIGAYNNYEEGTVSKVTDATTQVAQLSKVVDEARYIENIVIPEPGRYVFTFYSGVSYCTVGSFYLVENGTGTATSVAALTGSVDKHNLSLDGIPSAQMSVTGLTMSDGTAGDLSAYQISYKSSDNSVATVDATGKITAVGEGSAEITAYTTDAYGATAGYIEKINVRENGVILDYNFARAQVQGPVKEWKVATYNAETQTAESRAKILADAKFENITYEKTCGFLRFADINIDTTGYSKLVDGTYNFYDTYWEGCGVRLYGDAYQLCGGKYIIFEIEVPVAGSYETTLFLRSGSTNTAYNIKASLYVSEDRESVLYKTKEVGTFNAYTSPEQLEVKSVNFPTAGKYYVAVKVSGSSTGTHTMFRAVSFKNGTSNAIIGGKITSTASEINVDEGETATVSASGYLSGTAIDEEKALDKIEEYDATAATFTYSSSNTSIATVDATTGVVTPVSAGKVTITATANNSTVANTLTTDITVTENLPGEAVTDTTVSVGIIALEGGSVATNLSSAVSEVEIGTKVTAEATANDGYEFAYWKDSNGKVLSTNAKETFVINVNTSIKAYFEKTVSESDTTAPVYFYNGNGEALGSETVEKGKTFADVTKPEASLTGFAFDKWSIADNAVINSLTRAVALFKDTSKTYAVKVDGADVATGKKYGESVTVKAEEENFSCWKLGNKVMSYDKEFKFNVYGDINLTKVCEGANEAVPTVILDKIDGEHFLTYDVPAGYTLVEAGILFAESGNPTIGSFYAKATAKTGSGQFTAKPNGDETIAVGYIIFRDASGNLRVIYS